MSLQNLTLVTNKKLTNLQDAVIRQSEKGLTITAVFLNEDSSPYDLTNKKVIFNEHKESDKYVVDTNVQITDARNGAISYTLHPQCYAATGEAWFEIANSSGTVVDSTQNFNLKVKDAANASIYNTNYITQLDALRDQMQKLVDGADGQLKQQLQTTQNQLNQKLTDIGNAYQIAEQGRATAYKQAEANRDSGWTQDKQRIDTEWNQDKDRINGEWASQKQSIQNTANSQQSSISSQWSQLKNNADSQLATIQSNINALQTTIDDINKNKVPGLNSSLQSAQDKLDKILQSLGNFVVSANDVDQAVSKGIANISGTLLEPNINNWTQNNAASKASINIDYQDGVNNFTFTGVGGTEIIDSKFNVKPNTDYILTFTYSADKINSINNGFLYIALWYESLVNYAGTWSTDFNPKSNGQVLRIPANKSGNYSLKVNSQGLTEMHIGINFNDFFDGRINKFKISNLVVREANSTLIGLTDAINSLQGKYFQVQDLPANTNVDNFSQTGLYNLRGQAGITGLPQGGNIWGTLLVFNNNNNNNGIQMYLNSNDDYFFYREWNKSKGFIERRPWKRLASMTDVQPLWDKLNLSSNLSRYLSLDSTWADIFGNNDTNYGHLTAFKADHTGKFSTLYGLDESGIAFGCGDTRGLLAVRYNDHQARIAGGNGDSPTWREDIAWKSDFANYYNKPEVDSKVSYLQGQIDNTNSKLNITTPISRGTINSGSNWAQLLGSNDRNVGHVSVFKSMSNNDERFVYGCASAGIAFGADDTRGVFSVHWDKPGVKVAGGNGDTPVWSEELAFKSDFGNYYNKPEVDGMINALKSRCNNLESTVWQLQDKINSLLTLIETSNGKVSINGTLAVKGQIQQTYGGTDQYVAYAPNGARRGYFGFYDGGDFVTKKG